ncbi:hypothetical protein [Niveibacterium sp. COAC-50]|uniref:hypothetical protein n=1 Tax=Niveibacterium sp. COAC-50 TaxID=2729384 RepID=UPI001554AEE8|nr:hypothetical protein [Niveibacterium sp. COAC-50]
MSTLTSDRYVLKCIYEMYKDQYPRSNSDVVVSDNDPYIAINLQALAEKLDCSPELLFGRLYYHLDRKHRYKQEDGALVSLFTLKVGEKKHAVNFPFLASILAGENRDFLRFIMPLSMSGLALLISATSLVISILLKR